VGPRPWRAREKLRSAGTSSGGRELIFQTELPPMGETKTRDGQLLFASNPGKMRRGAGCLRDCQILGFKLFSKVWCSCSAFELIR